MAELFSAQDLEARLLDPFGHLRVSGKGQAEGDGFTRLLTLIRPYAEAHGIEIVRVFREEGVSGAKDLENRLVLSDLMIAVHANGVNLVRVEKLDRLARDLIIQETILGQLPKHGSELVSVTQPNVGSKDPTRKLIRQIMGAVAECEAFMIVLRLRGPLECAGPKWGRCEGRKPYEFHPGESRVIDRMRELLPSGMSFDRIAVQLNSDAVRPRSGERWHGLVVNWILAAHGGRTSEPN